MSWLGGPRAQNRWTDHSFLTMAGSFSLHLFLDAGCLCLKPSVRGYMVPDGGDFSCTCSPVFPQLQSSSEREIRWWQPCFWHPGPRWAVGPSSLPLSSFTLKKTEKGSRWALLWKPMLPPAGLELVERWVMWRDGVQRPGKERHEWGEGRGIVFCKVVGLALPAEGSGE